MRKPRATGRGLRRAAADGAWNLHGLHQPLSQPWPSCTGGRDFLGVWRKSAPQIIAGACSFLDTWFAGTFFYDMCAARVRYGCDPAMITLVGVGVMAVIVAAGLLGGLGARWARRNAKPTWPWPAGTLVLIVVCTAAGLGALNTLLMV